MGKRNSKFEDHSAETYNQVKSERIKRKWNKKVVHADKRETNIKSLMLHHIQLDGDHETQESEGGEASLLKYYEDCDKNPGHPNFIPVDTFSLKHLPKGYQDTDLYELIKAVAELTIRVDVKMTSPQRPQFWPGTTAPYPFYNLRGKSTLKTGTGMVCNVHKITDGSRDDGKKQINGYTRCWCTVCDISDRPSSVWWEFHVVTATQVVFDDIEASHTSLILFYDRDDRTVDIHYKVSVSQISSVSIDNDRCRLRCVTCDESIGDKLFRSFRHFYDFSEKVRDKFKSSRGRHRITFIVSHPHGYSKQVSVGKWQSMYKVNGYLTKCTYTTFTCPGSSGARVYCVGFHEGWHNELVHSGTYKPSLNYSGVGFLHD